MTFSIGATKDSFSVACPTEGWHHAGGTLSASYGSAAWDGKATVTFPPNKRDPHPFTHQGQATFEHGSEGCSNLKIYWSDDTVWCQGLKVRQLQIRTQNGATSRFSQHLWCWIWCWGSQPKHVSNPA